MAFRPATNEGTWWTSFL